MFYVLIDNGRAVSTTTEFPRMNDGSYDRRYEHRHDWKTMDRAREVASQLTESTGTLHLATDSGPNVSPRYDVILAPKVGDEVSKGFNGDYYPEGEIVRISASYRRIVTSTDAVFYRRGESGSWIQDGTWTLVAGVRNERNPSF
jgi:hypothetical protein